MVFSPPTLVRVVGIGMRAALEIGSQRMGRDGAVLAIRVGEAGLSAVGAGAIQSDGRTNGSPSSPAQNVLEPRRRRGDRRIGGQSTLNHLRRPNATATNPGHVSATRSQPRLSRR